MTHYRSEIRAALRLTFSVTPHFASFSQKSAWSQNVDAASLPVIGVATPNERKDLTAQDAADRFVTIVVVVKHRGGEDIEDVLDIDSVQLERAVLQTIQTIGYDGQLESTDLDIAGSAEQRVGTLTMAFRVFISTPEPINL